MPKGKKYVRGAIVGVLLICTAFLICSIFTTPLGDHYIMLALAVTAGFIALGSDKSECK